VTVSTHVLDASVGRPASGVAVALWVYGPSGDWVAVESGETDGDGRHRFGAVVPAGVYRLVFGTGAYFEARGVAAFYPEVVITFTVSEGHYHVPLLLSPFAYSTYRGS
jgi:5-hydroxyisourate hydrolase